ncbi:SIMPL domain-containing protein [Archaeoglobus veneficus]|uniref:DUF541 domain-containing protein n=1 Tax=Archaeoglobus veneficus (strain DSM 11195 / SNP6) TaxID=693661 RepID=F2KQZ6_ARCVS|nr:SIMPL domain-containing protein [Archaeoglobus veneficus]AEA47802.1 protein of unknown function DUF541 [Archaeoglobus veneficus SNP6]
METGKKFLLAAVLALVLAIVAVSGSQSIATSQNFNKTISVTGTGVVKAEPDEAHVAISVVTEAKNASKAAELNAERMNAVFKEIMSVVGEEAIKTRSYSIEPIYEWVEESDGIIKKQRSEIVGYRVSNTVEVTCNPSKAGSVIDAAVRGGANRIVSIYFQLSEERRSELYKEALKKAVRSASEKVEAVAEEMSVDSYYPVRISIGDVYYPSVVPYPVKAEVMEAVPTPIAPSEVEVRASVHIVYAFA